MKVGAPLLLLLATVISILTTSYIPQTAARPIIQATVQISPSRFGRSRPSEFFTFYIELPPQYSIKDVDVSSIILNNLVEFDTNLTISIGDQNKNGIPDLAVKFSRDSVLANTDIGAYEWWFFGRRSFRAVLTLSGELTDGNLFQGSCKMLVIWPRIRPL